MVNNISWASYLYAISFILVIYYIVVLILYYRNDLQKYFLKSRESFNSPSTNRTAKVEKNEAQIIEPRINNEHKNGSIEKLLSNIKSLIKTSASRKFPREELLLSLQLELKNQSAFQDSTYRDIINNYIIEACENYYSIHLSEEEVSALWIK
jgi:hypothetical protein